jgi:hypothetical protein
MNKKINKITTKNKIKKKEKNIEIKWRRIAKANSKYVEKRKGCCK